MMLIKLNEKDRVPGDLRKYLLKTIQEILANREVIDKATRDKQREDIIESYKRSVGLDKLEKRHKKMQEDLDAIEGEMEALGYNVSCGNVSKVTDGQQIYRRRMGKYVTVTAEQAEKSKKLHQLLEAVRKAVDVYPEAKQLETQLMMAPTVGDALVIINAIVGKEVFKVQPALEDKKKPSKQPLAQG